MSTPSDTTIARSPSDQSVAQSNNTNNDAENQPAAPVPPQGAFPEGGLMGWLCVAGSWLAIFATFGYANAFGVFQAYYATGYPNQTASDISWIGSIQLFLQMSFGAIAGPLYDKGYFTHLMVTGTALYAVCLFMTSLCKEFWQTVLTQGFGIGIGIGCIYLPAVSIVSQYFMRRRVLAIGISASGSAFGGICLPIMLNNLIAIHGFKLAVQYTGYLITSLLVMACCLMRPRITSNGPRPPKLSMKELFADRAYALMVAGMCVVVWGLFFPIFYLQVFAISKGLSVHLVFYTVAILNAASVLGRVTPNIIAGYFGTINLIAVMCCISGMLCFCIFGAGTPAGLIIVAILYGFFSGAFLSLGPPALMSFAKSPQEIGSRVGMGFLVISIPALTGTPITGALLDKFGFYAPIIWSGVSMIIGAAIVGGASLMVQRRKGTWKI